MTTTTPTEIPPQQSRPLDQAVALITAVRDFATSMDGLVAVSVAEHLTCTEVDAVARLLALAGFRDTARTWLSSHAMHDEADDAHHPADTDLDDYLDDLCTRE